MMIPILIGVLIVLAIIYDGFFTVDQQTVAIVERLGKFNRAATAGFNMKIPFIDRVRGRVSLRIQQLNVPVDTKTRDNVFVAIAVSVQYFIAEDKIFQAFYKLTDPARQIQSFVFDVVRAQVPGMNLDDVFERKDDIAVAVKTELTDVMSEFGYGIVKALVTDINPDEKVKQAMNEINEAQRMRVAAQERGEAEKILRVKAAEAEAESMRLRGQGIADQRKAIITGLKQSVDDFKLGIPGIKTEDVMNLVLMTQYFDAIKEIGANSKSNAILLPHSPGGLHDIAEQLKVGIITANLTTSDIK
jgi:regulator of protease activity HflC (stomatin/prohibitin superfamily)